ncbi:response regulator [Acidiluteibacter ferrifornacis]|uniref:Response regulator n=1 Tax=Acidiluteibacter ferrifornacis TaxID=2692424 RepID=A0A6N9NKC9_9FLAO|nr:response regulator [Acidiluteibacter ferrifornacis]NBG66322.1 response regulator [Acidiluteibacter ferrifornacis]
MKKKILLIEDDEAIRENTAEILELANYEVATAENGKVGVRKSKEVKPDLIICDIMMPELDGYGVLYLLGKDPETSTIPFIFLTAKTEKSDRRKGMMMGADDYLTKPFEEMDLLNAIEGRLKRNVALKQSFIRDAKGLEDFVEIAKGLKELEEITASKQVRQHKKKDTLYFERDFPNAVFLLTKGKVKTYKINDDAKEYITGILKEGDFFGYLPIMEDRAYDECAVCIEDSEVVKISKQDFLQLIEKNREVASKFIKMISNDLVEREKKLLSLAYDSVRKRAANALLELKERFGANDKNYRIDMLRSDLASMVGTASESIIRTLTDFKEEGLIEVKGKEIRIINADGLKNVW